MGHGHVTRVYSRTFAETAARPRIVLDFAEIDGRAVCVRVEVGYDFASPESAGPRELRTGSLRGLAWTSLVDEALAGYAKDLRKMAAGALGPGVRRRARRRLPAAKRALEEPKRPGRPRFWGDEHFEAVAELYNSERRAGRRAPTKAVAENWSISKSCAAKWVARARKSGLIVP